jgi:DNA-binding CsgD family transcriptional regulator
MLRACAALFRSLTPSALTYIRGALGEALPPSTWEEFVDLALAGEADQRPDGTADLRVAAAGDSSAERRTVEAARLLLAYWIDHQDSELAVDAAHWAVLTGAWSTLSALWGGHLIVTGSWRSAEAIELFSNLPVQARQESPLLTLAWAQARSSSARGAAAERQMRRDLLADVTSLHAKWRDATELDAVLLGASMCMLTHRATPGVDPTSALDLAWEAHDEAAMALERRRVEANSATSGAELVFRAVSAHNALARADLERAVVEADRAAMINPLGASRIADGAGALARELSGVGLDAHGGVDEPGDYEQRVLTFGARWDLTAADSTASHLALALSAIRSLDRAECEKALAKLGELEPGAALWTAGLYVQALHAALWGDPAAALTHHDNVLADHALSSVEQLEPLGRGLLHHARIALLDRLGASEAALTASSGLNGEWRPLLEARSLLWAGDHESARRIAEAGLYGTTMRLADRASLRAVRAGACILDRGAGDAYRIQVVRETFADCIGRNSIIPIAMLPGDLRSEMLAMYLANRGDLEEPEGEARLLAGLRGVASTAAMAASPIPLTRREKTLLPLLATADAVPDIAASLHVSANTVRTQVANLRRKFGAKSRSELVRMARNAGLL